MFSLGPSLHPRHIHPVSGSFDLLSIVYLLPISTLQRCYLFRLLQTSCCCQQSFVRHGSGCRYPWTLLSLNTSRSWIELESFTAVDPFVGVSSFLLQLFIPHVAYTNTPLRLVLAFFSGFGTSLLLRSFFIATKPHKKTEKRTKDITKNIHLFSFYSVFLSPVFYISLAIFTSALSFRRTFLLCLPLFCS